MTTATETTGPPSSPTARPVIEVRAIYRRFGSTQALDGASLALRPGEVHALIGENGAGKSTLIKIMTGVDQPDAGEILVDGEPVQLANALAAQAAGDRRDLPGADDLPGPVGRGEHLHQPSRPRAGSSTAAPPGATPSASSTASASTSTSTSRREA